MWGNIAYMDDMGMEIEISQYIETTSTLQKMSPYPNLWKRKIINSKVSVDRGYVSSSLLSSISLDKC